MVGKQSLPTDYHENPETMEHEATDGRNWNISVYRSLQASLVAQMVKRLPANAGDQGSIPGLGRSPGEGNGNPL